tara:strand:- start:435 stop:584 length:150 start_codon:yes stop_codon:yes gene_type:complete
MVVLQLFLQSLQLVVEEEVYLVVVLDQMEDPEAVAEDKVLEVAQEIRPL